MNCAYKYVYKITKLDKELDDIIIHYLVRHKFDRLRQNLQSMYDNRKFYLSDSKLNKNTYIELDYYFVIKNVNYNFGMLRLNKLYDFLPDCLFDHITIKSKEDYKISSSHRRYSYGRHKNLHGAIHGLYELFYNYRSEWDANDIILDIPCLYCKIITLDEENKELVNKIMNKYRILIK